MKDTIGVNNPMRYKGYYYDSETQMYYCKSRYYNPDFCRWISGDSEKYIDTETPLGLNLFIYCNNDPANKYDPSGHVAWWVIPLVGFVVGAVVGGISAAAQKQNVFAGVLIGGSTGALNALAATLPPYLSIPCAAVIGFVSDMYSQYYLEGKKLLDIDLSQSLFCGITNAVLSIPGKLLSIFSTSSFLLDDFSTVLVEVLTNTPLTSLTTVVNMIPTKDNKEFTIKDLIEKITGKKAPITTYIWFE